MHTLTDIFRRPGMAAVFLAAAGVPVFLPGAGSAAAQESAHAASAAIDTAHPAAQALPGFADLVEKVSPAVVTVSATVRQSSEEGQQSPFPPGSPQDRMFGQFFGQQPEPSARTVHALGSGFIIDAQGRIVTNNHVVKDASGIEVTMADGRKFPAKVVGVDAKTDLALLQVKSDTPLPHLALGNSDTVRVGDWVVAVGNPFGLGGTVTAGILSARGRQIGEGPYDDFLQIDAPINRGNSGGPLFAQDGTVIGVNTAIYSPSGGSVGIGFAIPSSVVSQVIDQLETSGKVTRGYLGVGSQALSPAMVTALHLGDLHGALVAEVQPDSPAATAGIEPGDVIESIDGKGIKDPHDLARVVAALQAGSSHDVAVRRDGKDVTIKVTLASFPEQDDAAQSSGSKLPSSTAFGLAFVPLDRQARESLSASSSIRGVVVDSVTQGSPAETAGLKPGDIVEEIAGHPVLSPAQAMSALRDATRASGSAVAMRVWRAGHQSYVALGGADNDAD